MSFNLRGLARPCLSLMEHVIMCPRASGFDVPGLQMHSRFALCTAASSSNQGISKNTISNVLSSWENRFKSEQIPEPRNSVQNIVLHVMGGRTFAELDKFAEVEMTEEEVEETNRLCECRLARMPVQYVIGEWEFKGSRLKMAPPVFIPRPETEQLVDIAYSCLPHSNECDTCAISEGCKVNVLEFGCGSGAVSLALSRMHPKVLCTAVDQSTMACRLTQENAIKLGLHEHIRVVHSKLSDDGQFSKDLGVSMFDLIVSNPPYVPSKDMRVLEPEITLYEDLRALDGGEDGLRFVKPLLKVASKLLRHKGCIVMEVDASHPPKIEKWLMEPEQSNLRLKYQKTHEDIFKKPRFVQIVKMRSA